MQCGEEITTTDTWKLKGNKDYNLYRRQTVSSGLHLVSLVSVLVSVTKAHPAVL